MLLVSQVAIAQPSCEATFVNPQARFQSNVARPSASPFLLHADAKALDETSYQPRNAPKRFTLGEYLGAFCTTGFLVLKEDRILFERYLQGRGQADKLLSASMSKTILALLVGIAIKERKIALSDRVVEVLPDFKDSAFAGATLEDLLRMASGAELSVSYQRGATSDNAATNPILSPHRDVRAYLRDKTARASEPGKTFDYNGAQTALIGLMLAERIGSSLTRYLEEKLWQPMGAEDSGYWIKNNHGQEGVQGQFAATLRDYARLGYLIMNKGQVDGRNVVPSDWIDNMVELRRDKPQPRAAPFYGLHIWIPQAAGGRSFLWGTNGQNIFIDPVARVVIVHTGNSRNAEFDGNSHLFPLRDSIVSSVR